MSLLTDRRAAPSAPRAWSVLGEPREAHLGYLLVLPAYLFIVGLTIFPILYAVYISLHRLSLTLPGMPFVGLANYVSILTAPSFWQAVAVTTYFVVISLLLQFPLGLAVALVLNEQVRGRAVLRAAILIPWAIPAVMAGIIWRWVFRGDVGVLNGLLYSLGLIESYRSFLGDPITAKLALVIAHLWKHLPLATILLLATLQVIPRELYDAAKLDGAGTWQLFRSITFPFLKPTLAVVLIFDTIVAFTTFDLVFAMTGGGPANATTLIAWYIYNEIFTNLNLGRGAALAFLVALVTLVLALVYLRALRTERFYREG